MDGVGQAIIIKLEAAERGCSFVKTKVCYIRSSWDFFGGGSISEDIISMASRDVQYSEEERC